MEAEHTLQLNACEKDSYKLGFFWFITVWFKLLRCPIGHTM